jgi:hypothetical protein
VATERLGQGVATGWLRHSARRRKAPNRAGERVNGEATGRAVAGGDHAGSLITDAGEGADKRSRVDRERADAGKGQERLTGGAGLVVGAVRARAGGGPSWASGGGDECAGERGGGAWAGIGPTGGGEKFLFLFLFLFPFLLLFLFFYNLFFL